MPEPPPSFTDECAGVVDTSRWGGDFVVKRADGLWSYQLAVVVDDSAQGVTEVVRGDDLLSSTARQLALYEALGLIPPSFFHVPVLRDDQGRRLSTRFGATTVRDLRANGATRDEILKLAGVPPGRST